MSVGFERKRRTEANAVILDVRNNQIFIYDFIFKKKTAQRLPRTYYTTPVDYEVQKPNNRFLIKKNIY